jgi:hypothetical protein
MVNKQTAVNKAVKKELKKELDKQIEDKQAGAVISATNADNIAQFTLINNIDQGTAQGQRVGTRIRLKSCNIMTAFSVNGTAATLGPGAVRELLILDHQPNGAAPNVTQLFLNTTAGLEYLSPMNENGKARYKVLMDKRFTVEIAGGSVNIPQLIQRKHHVKLSKALSIYNGTGTAIANINTNSLWYVVITNISSAATNPVGYLGNIDLIYEDA